MKALNLRKIFICVMLLLLPLTCYGWKGGGIEPKEGMIIEVEEGRHQCVCVSTRVLFELFDRFSSYVDPIFKLAVLNEYENKGLCWELRGGMRARILKVRAVIEKDKAYLFEIEDEKGNRGVTVSTFFIPVSYYDEGVGYKRYKNDGKVRIEVIE